MLETGDEVPYYIVLHVALFSGITPKQIQRVNFEKKVVVIHRGRHSYNNVIIFPLCYILG